MVTFYSEVKHVDSLVYEADWQDGALAALLFHAASDTEATVLEEVTSEWVATKAWRQITRRHPWTAL